MTRVANITHSLLFGDSPPTTARVWRRMRGGTSGSRLLSMQHSWDEAYGSEVPSTEYFNFDSLVEFTRRFLTERDSHSCPWEAVSITSSAIMHELWDSEHEGFWDRLNNRRIFLIDRELNSSLSDHELAELEWMQARFSAYVDAIAPLPFNELEALEEELLEEQLSEIRNDSNSQEQD